MTGIYKITNKTTGRTYIGQAKDLKRRFAEYRCPKRSHNQRLNEDIDKYGIDDFIFEVVEICCENELNTRELHYIRELLPYYNCIGKPRSDETKEKLRTAGKAQWARMSESQKKRVIENNLTGPRKGHKVSKETREKLRKSNTGKRRYKPVVIVETGQEFPSAIECAEYLGVSPSAVRYNLCGKTNKTKGYRIVYK